jgi:hypothetical protein
VRALARTWSKLKLDWDIALHRLPFFTQKTAVLLVGVLVATLALLGGVISLVGPPGSVGPARLDPGGSARKPTATTRPAADRAGGGSGAAGEEPAPAGTPTPAQAPGRAAGSAGTQAGSAGQPGGGGAAAPTTTLGPTTTTGDELLPPVDDLLGTVVSTLLPR